MVIQFARVLDGEVDEYFRYDPMPNSELSEKASNNIYPVNRNIPDTKPWERRGGRSETFTGTSVDWNWQIRTLTVNDWKKKARKELLKNAKTILESRLDPVEQLPSVYKHLPAARRNAMDSDAQAVIAEVGQKRTQINNASTYEEVDAIYTGIVAFMDPADIDENGWPIPDEVV